MGKNKKKYNGSYTQQYDDDYEEKYHLRNRPKPQKEKTNVDFEFDECFFEKEHHRKKRETNQRKKREQRAKEDRWN